MKSIEWKLEGTILSGEFYIGAAIDTSTIKVQDIQKVMAQLRQEIAKNIYTQAKRAILEELADQQVGTLTIHNTPFKVIADTEVEPTIIISPQTIAYVKIMGDSEFINKIQDKDKR